MFVYRKNFGSKTPKLKKQRAHIWDDRLQDTACKMWSTGGITNRAAFIFADDASGRQICAMCQTNNVKRNFAQARAAEAEEAHSAGLVIWGEDWEEANDLFARP